MNSPRIALFKIVALAFLYSPGSASPNYGFCLPDSVNEMTLHYRSVRNLIILPVVLNDSVKVNLILDTGCRNLVLFGKRFQKMLKITPGRQVQFSGLGSGKPVKGFFSLSNKVSIQQVLGERIPIVVVPNKNVMSFYSNIDGVIGYDIFLKFEIELNPLAGTITFRPALRSVPPQDYVKIPLRIVDCRPVMDAEILVRSEKNKKYDLMIDTGSTLGLLLKTTDMTEFSAVITRKIIGLGFNGPITGYNTVADELHLDGFDMDDLPAGIIQSAWHNYASVGMAVLKDYSFIMNYVKSYVCLKKLST